MELETLLTRVWNPDIRPLTDEAWRSYNAGAFRACIATTWTAITADIIGKLVTLADDGDPRATAFRTELNAAQANGLSTESVRAMQNIENELLAKATELELIDTIDQRELERLREDRNLCVHPSLRSLGEVYTPRPESARAHLATALSTLLTHPPTQGGKAVTAFQNYTCDPSFVPETAHIQAVFYDRVRSAARSNIAKIAAKHALRELDPDGRLNQVEYANRAAVVLHAFAQRDRDLVRSALVSQRERFQQVDGGSQLRALSRLGAHDYFWEMVDDPLAGRLQGLLLALPVPDPWDPLPTDVAEFLSVVRIDYARERFPKLEGRFTALTAKHRMAVIANAPAPYFVASVIDLLREAWNYRTGDQVGQLLVQHASFLTVEQLSDALTAWANNDQCRMAMQMPDLAAALYRATAHLGTAQPPAFVGFITTVQSLADPDDSYYCYPALEGALRTAGHLP